MFTVPAAGGDPGAGPAERLSAKVVVKPGRSHFCWSLRPGVTLSVEAGDRIEFVANDRPTVAGGTVEIQVGPWFATRPTGGRAAEPRVVVVLTAVRPASLSVSWTDCSGAGC